VVDEEAAAARIWSSGIPEAFVNLGPRDARQFSFQARKFSVRSRRSLVHRAGLEDASDA